MNFNSEFVCMPLPFNVRKTSIKRPVLVVQFSNSSYFSKILPSSCNPETISSLEVPQIVHHLVDRKIKADLGSCLDVVLCIVEDEDKRVNWRSGAAIWGPDWAKVKPRSGKLLTAALIIAVWPSRPNSATSSSLILRLLLLLRTCARCCRYRFSA